MPFYAYLCQQCGRNAVHAEYLSVGTISSRRCDSCGGLLRRAVSSPHIVRGMEWDFQPHFNNAVGAPVSSLHEFRSLLKQQSDRETEATGMAHDYQVLDPRDRDAFGVTDEGVQMNEAANRGVDLGDHMKKKTLDNNPAGWGDAPVLEGEKS